VLDGDLYAQHDLARLDEEQREAEYARIFWVEEERPASTRSGLGGDTCRASTTCVQSAGSDVPPITLGPVDLVASGQDRPPTTTLTKTTLMR
jgi:hypothetical protein